MVFKDMSGYHVKIADDLLQTDRYFYFAQIEVNSNMKFFLYLVAFAIADPVVGKGPGGNCPEKKRCYKKCESWADNYFDDCMSMGKVQTINFWIPIHFA